MKNLYLIPAAALLLIATTSCDPKSPDAERLAELEQRNLEAQERQRELEEQLRDVRWAAEQDAIDRERELIAQQREELENLANDATAAREQALRTREQELARREGQLEQNQATQADRQADLDDRTDQLSTRDRKLAGREAIALRSAEQRIPVADYGMFYDSLASHGSWFETSDYGYVWQPAGANNPNWRPYSRGRWACSDRGWTWISEEPFGWATYHYGRWALLRGRGWIWVPGSEWAPSWVSWRESGSHIGWAPLPPETLAYRGRHRWNSTVDERFGITPSWYNFVEIRHFGEPIYAHRIPVTTNVTIIRKTVNITHIHVQNNQVISGGPRYQQINERVGRPLPYYRIEVDPSARGERDYDRMRPRIQNDRLMVSAPNVAADWNEELRPNQVQGSIGNVEVERRGTLDQEIATRYRESRENDQKKAKQSVKELGGQEHFEQARNEQLVENRRKVAAADPQARERPVRENLLPQPVEPVLPVEPVAEPPAPEISRPPLPDQEVTPPTLPPVVEQDQPDQVEDHLTPPDRPDRIRTEQDPAPGARERPGTRRPQETSPSPTEILPEPLGKEERAAEAGLDREGDRQREATPTLTPNVETPTAMPPAEISVEEESRETNVNPSNGDEATSDPEEDRRQEQARQLDQKQSETRARQEAERLALAAARQAQETQEAEMQARKEDEARAEIAARLQKEENDKLAQEAARMQQQEERRLQQEEMQRRQEEARAREEARRQQEEAQRQEEQARRQEEEAQRQEEQARRQEEQALREQENARRQEEAAREQAEQSRREESRQRDENQGEP